jgi:uncharacterized protein with NAD-binding domain and iron-sulfur cluster
VSQLPRVAILGGGVGGVTTAVALSRGDWQKRFGAITLYQQGWRLGGKGASGRGPGQRIEEHGLHIWFGFYENAFRMMRECHEELDALAKDPNNPRWSEAFTSVDDSFTACTEITLTDHDGCEWKPWVADFFAFDDDTPWADPDPRYPGERPEDWSAVFYASRCLHLAADLAASILRAPGPQAVIVAGAAPASDAVSAGLHELDDDVRGLWAAASPGTHTALRTAAELLDALIEEGVQNQSLLMLADPLLRALDLGLDFLRGRADELVRENDAVRRAWYVTDLLLAIVRGLVEDGVLAADDFSVVDDVEFCDWLRAHGAARESVDSALVRSVVYDLAFAYRKGDPRRPAAAAGTALRGLLRAFFTYRGAMMWKMNAGMGDVVFAPLYELLAKRGVDVRFFHRVEDVRASGGTVEEITIDVQAALDPKVGPGDFLDDPSTTPAAKAAAKATGVPQPSGAVWPARPKVALANPGTMATDPSVYESWLADPALARASTTVLKRGAATDGFELVVFALPPACIPRVAPDLMKQSPRWQAAADHIETVPTQAMQLWLDRPATDLGPHADGTVLGGYTEPFDTWADMAHLVAQEQVAGAKTVAYFCNVLAEAPLPPRGTPAAQAFLDDQLALVRAQALRFLKHDVRHLWPDAVDPVTGHLDWDVLVDPSGATGEARLTAQYLRANVEPSERYVLSVPGSGIHRIPPWDTGFANLYVAGDWTACGIDAGCVEAAAMSGLLAANAIHADVNAPDHIQPIIGYHGP